MNDTNPRLRIEPNTIFERGMSKNDEAVGEEFEPSVSFPSTVPYVQKRISYGFCFVGNAPTSREF